MAAVRQVILDSSSTGHAGASAIGTWSVPGFSRISGLISVIGSATLRWQMAATSGTWLVSSTTLINSGGYALDVLNAGKVFDLSWTAINSQVPRVFVVGEVNR